MITVTTRDIERTFPDAAGWAINDHGELHVTKDDQAVAAVFAPGEWQSVHHTAELAPDEPAKAATA